MSISFLYICGGLILLCFIVSIVSIFMLAAKRSQLKRYDEVDIGMSEDEMLSIMGGGYNVSSLKNNRKKYEWRMNASSYGYKGYRSYSGVHKVAIYTKDGKVEEIKPYNV